ncbi:hypothetical protein BC936DRAFT_147074 [Jimgerdemannia flammicorona]|uniref:Origin recognition complex subunit 6-domain-containing protein n=1 Tax=Jimgerdemannia flammicorona TaxID=994334 RepID=A0A433DL36_9FUNG|nr:hypothetical protein BC936DRAFT_147074 [Jimgerdemannia flammicorona]
MSTQNPILNILVRVNLADDKKLAAKAQDLFNNISAKIPTTTFKKAPNAKPVSCIQLACEVLHIPFHPALPPHKLASCTPTIYSNILQTVRRELDLQINVTFDSLAIVFGCTTVVPQVEGLWAHFCERYIGTLNAAQVPAAKMELEKPVWKGAVFWVCCKAVTIRIDKDQLLSQCICPLADLNRQIKTIEEYCEAELERLKTAGITRKRKRKGADEATEIEDTAGIEKQEDRQNLKQRKGYVEGVEEKEEEEEAKRDGGSKKKKRGGPEGSGKGKEKAKAGIEVALETEELENDVELEVNTTADAAGVGGQADVPSSGIVSMIPLQSYRNTKRYAEYVAWREETIQRLKEVTETTGKGKGKTAKTELVVS